MNRLLHFIGIAHRAGKVQKGAFLTERAVKRGDAALVLIARDASQGTRDKFSAMCRYYGIPHFLAETKEALGEVTGVTVQEEIIEQVFSKFCVGK